MKSALNLIIVWQLIGCMLMSPCSPAADCWVFFVGCHLESLIKIRGQLFGQPIERSFSKFRLIRFSNLWQSSGKSGYLNLCTHPRTHPSATYIHPPVQSRTLSHKQKNLPKLGQPCSPDKTLHSFIHVDKIISYLNKMLSSISRLSSWCSHLIYRKSPHLQRRRNE